MKKLLPLLVFATILLSGCSSDQNLKTHLANALKEDPRLLTDAINAHPAEFITALQNAAKLAQDEMGKAREAEEKKKLEESFEKPMVAEIRSDEAIRGAKDAPITLIEYSDFECPFCARGFETVQALLKKYEGKIRLVYKHLPLSFHEQAMITARYYEALRMQSPQIAFRFHDEVFKNQRKLKNGEAFLKETAKFVGADLKRLSMDLKSEAITKRIASDADEASRFGMQGTPGFLLNGVPVRGAYPPEYFVSVIEELQKRGKLKI